jgi:hypothetical protein
MHSEIGAKFTESAEEAETSPLLYHVLDYGLVVRAIREDIMADIWRDRGPEEGINAWLAWHHINWL